MTTKEAGPSSYENLIDFLHRVKPVADSLPQVLFVVSQDSYEFGVVSDLYKNAYKKSSDPYEIVVFVAEPGDLENFQSEAMNLDMFADRKLFIIKSGLNFFKPWVGKTKAKNSPKAGGFSLPDSVKVIVHYDHWDVPKELLNVFGQNVAYFKSPKLFPDKRKEAFLRACKEIDIKLDEEAEEEFLLKVSPSAGAYIKNLEKLKLYLGKKSFSVPDLREVLFQSSEFSSSEILEFFFEKDYIRFSREFSKFKIGKDSLLIFLSLLKDALDRLRIYKVIFRHYDKVLSEKEQAELLGIESYSPGRKMHTFKRLKKENSLFSDLEVQELYEFLLEMNQRIKTGAEKEDTVYYFLTKVQDFFHRSNRTIRTR
ncbi:DNA polymerase III subunit delta [Leptospira wolffii]|uniref:DNA polymerase III subunit delta n=1 Tax=Leptospira wolffii TaxID=409998 RepID=UPI0010843A2B|nr:DNA polymerase III subunit delta [Leptospira wolffii]TGK61874.1 DNA polymerase III subunit delta [Leptospira wolffii]TGK67510.1 DNA polymerase III subunit delta [Leptospira wolffii]TGK74742.1 DNA polymerase III subunit delta [Leptospira wolffii]TGL31682.1 DNA polymerase III subunit delta [Leptospira wolffii]